MTWNAVAEHWNTDKGFHAGNGHGYMHHYEALLADHPVRTVLEVGVAGGASLRMWADLFPGAEIIGVDNSPPCMAQEAGHVHVVIGDATEPEVCEALAYEYGPFDLIVDDGSHLPWHIARTWRLLWPYVSPGGFYIVEDTYAEGYTAVCWDGMVAGWLSDHAPVAVMYDTNAEPVNAGPCLIVMQRTETP